MAAAEGGSTGSSGFSADGVLISAGEVDRGEYINEKIKHDLSFVTQYHENRRTDTESICSSGDIRASVRSRFESLWSASRQSLL